MQILSETEVARALALSAARGNSSICNRIADPAEIAVRAKTAGRASAVTLLSSAAIFFCMKINANLTQLLIFFL